MKNVLDLKMSDKSYSMSAFIFKYALILSMHETLFKC